MRIVETSDKLSDEDEIFIRMELSHGMIMGFAVVQVSEINGAEHQIVRYDCSHGYAHKDCLYEARNRKEELPDKPLDELCNEAIGEIRREWKNYRSRFMRNRLARRS
jgi:hypothetical protein